jgi:hypothetical protein
MSRRSPGQAFNFVGPLAVRFEPEAADDAAPADPRLIFRANDVKNQEGYGDRELNDTTRRQLKTTKGRYGRAGGMSGPPTCALVEQWFGDVDADVLPKWGRQEVEKDTDLEIRKHVQETAENVGIPVE